jgi:hypothetical protein
MIYDNKRIQRKINKEKVYRLDSRGNQTQAPKCLLPMELHRMYDTQQKLGPHVWNFVNLGHSVEIEELEASA